jgi:radical SAM superfamily enzyme YgiQ (UPF0313 family)
VPLAETVHERYAVEIFRGCTRGCRFCQAGMITRPVRERSITTVGQMVKEGLEFSGFSEVGLLSLSSADHSEIGDMCSGLAEQYADTNVSLSLPSTRVDAFNIDLAQELSRNGRRTGLTFAPEGGSERIRKVINKMVTEEGPDPDGRHGVLERLAQVKLYFMCGLPTETDDDVLQIGRMAHEVIKAGPERRRLQGQSGCYGVDLRVVPQAAHAVPVGSMASTRVDRRRLEDAQGRSTATGRWDARSATAIHDGEPSADRGPAAPVATAGWGRWIRRVWE